MARQPDKAELHDTYRAYLIRLWRDTPQARWRVSAQSTETGEVIRFADLKALYAFLDSQSADTPTTESPPAEQIKG